jgi:hypothetical protein
MEMTIAKLGNVNGFVRSTAWIGKKSFEFDGTIKGLVKSAIANGAKEGSKIEMAIGSRLRSTAKKMEIISAPHDDRAGGFWAI